jgi:hypothetical protein
VINELRYDTQAASLTCTTSGGPVTNVTWAQNQLQLQDNNQTVLIHQSVDLITVVYRNVLVLRRGREQENVGVYRCHISNARGNSSMELMVAGMCAC